MSVSAVGSMGVSACLRVLHGPVYRRRIGALARLLASEVRMGDRVLDVGCGSGALGAAILADPARPAGVHYEGAEVAPRPGTPFPVTAFDQGRRLPFADKSFDVVVAADVLHHVPDESALLKDIGRVARRRVFLKDHCLHGVLAQARLSFIDWAANYGHGVPCLYRYHDLQGWHDLFAGTGLAMAKEHLGLNLYPPGLNLLFGRRLQYLALLEPSPIDP